jgi:hypothetical protein
MATIKGSDLARAIENNLRLYTDEAVAAIRQQVDLTATVIKNEIQAASPVKSGAYRRGWGITKRDTQGVTSRIVHNKSRYQLAHLLERGHAKRGGGRVAARPHIAPAADRHLNELVENIKAILRNGGKP